MRDRLYIIAEILAIAKDGSLKTQIMYRANLSFTQLNDYLNFLLQRGLIKVDTENNKTFYKTTSNGIKYLENYEAISSLLRKSVEPNQKQTLVIAQARKVGDKE